jgi:hypothetical protein
MRRKSATGKPRKATKVGESVVFVVVLPPQCGCWSEARVARRSMSKWRVGNVERRDWA